MKNQCYDLHRIRSLLSTLLEGDDDKYQEVEYCLKNEFGITIAEAQLISATTPVAERSRAYGDILRSVTRSNYLP